MNFVEMLEFIIEYLNIDFDYEIVEDEKELKAVADLFGEILEDTEFVF